ncbi:unnamed protein product, partial [Musa acuminata subsp. burmannicoides]
MKYNPRVSGSRWKCRKEHFTAPSSVRRVLMSALLSADGVTSTTRGRSRCARTKRCRWWRGTHKGRDGKIVQVYRRKWVIHVERITREKVNGTTVKVNINLCKVVITKLKLDKYRKAHGKFSAEEVVAGAPSLQEDNRSHRYDQGSADEMFLSLRSCKEVLNEKTNAAKTNLKNDPKENETKNRGRRSGEGFLELTSRQALEKEFANKRKGIIIPTERREKREEGLESVEGGD